MSRIDFFFWKEQVQSVDQKQARKGVGIMNEALWETEKLQRRPLFQEMKAHSFVRRTNRLSCHCFTKGVSQMTDPNIHLLRTFQEDTLQKKRKQKSLLYQIWTKHEKSSNRITTKIWERWSRLIWIQDTQRAGSTLFIYANNKILIKLWLENNLTIWIKGTCQPLNS